MLKIRVSENHLVPAFIHIYIHTQDISELIDQIANLEKTFQLA